MCGLRWVLQKRLKQTKILKLVECILEKKFPESHPGFFGLIITKTLCDSALMQYAHSWYPQ